MGISGSLWVDVRMRQSAWGADIGYLVLVYQIIDRAMQYQAQLVP